MSENPARRKFVDTLISDETFSRELVKHNIVKLSPLRTHIMVADALTQSLPSPAFILHRKAMLGQTPFL